MNPTEEDFELAARSFSPSPTREEMITALLKCHTALHGCSYGYAPESEILVCQDCDSRASAPHKPNCRIAAALAMGQAVFDKIRDAAK